LTYVGEMASNRWFARTGLTMLAVVLGLAGAALIWFATADTEGEPTTPSFTASGSEIIPTATTNPTGTPRAGRTGVPDEISGMVLVESKPLEVSIPRLEVRSRLVPLGVDAAGAMEVPQTAGLAGWYTRGPTPGALGPSVIAAHVDLDGELGVFYRLGTMRVGDRVAVSRADGRTAIFSVTRVAKYAKADFPTAAVFGSIDHAGLRLITCGGAFDESQKQYVDNIVVYATLVSQRPTTR
jgi:sortase (surface protein transpeptidase)